ncbi:hypothetical protein IMG5_116400 [Ichthyophthirius multifiliis]|uniref:Calponin-homology (CH) domain-containing protein n=1 Tax=Ichthyophthirius multifiliis TaxID=5932 RepID=G0QUD2_ICHMU|nr:hypothetical protein IMG5_116400 [Ichthyophthirius multifiliis]EGR31169.1 hypothetical protein IMG5_116400 [Ichthyophthirius multifiliis]|eukprot:XP_004034655.1 hypothetical protein IMG5_116400 [Ichthyophthirius multifiliis]
MSDLLFGWLNDEVQLSKKIISFEEDFSNGYFFGELLSKYNQQLNFDEFKNKDIRTAKIKNFNLLQPTFTTLKIKFDTITVDQIIKCQKNVAANILYQLKMALEKVNNPADMIFSSKSGKYNTITPLMKINPPIDQYAKMESHFFDQLINQKNKPQKVVNLDKHLEHYDKYKKQQDQIIYQQKQKYEEEYKALRDQMRKIQLNKLQRNMAFQEDWNDKGQEQWKKNQEIRKQSELADQQFTQKITLKAQNKLNTIKETTKNEVLGDIEQFELSLKKKGLILEEDNNGNIIKKENKNLVSATATMNRIKEKQKLNEFLRKERDKRRRKMIVDQSKLQRDIQVKKREELVLKKLEQQSRQVIILLQILFKIKQKKEKEIEYEVWRAQQCKQIIIENRRIRQDKYKQKNEVMVINAKYKEEEMLKQLKEENNKDIKSKLVRQNEIEIQQKQMQRKQNYFKCQDIVHQFIDLANICYDQQQLNDTNLIDTNLFQNQLHLFINEMNLIKTKQFANADIIQNLKQQYEDQQESKKFVISKQFQDYLTGQGIWVPQHNFPQNEEDEKNIPNHAINNYFLGDLIIQILEKYYEQKLEEQKKIKNNHFDWLPIKIAILGYQFSGKKTIANLLQQKYNVKILSVEKLLNDLIDTWRQYQQKQQQIQQKILKTQEIENILLDGKEIPDEYYIKLIMKELNKIHPEVSEEQFLENYEKILYLNDNHNDQQLCIDNENRDIEFPLTQEDIFKNQLSNKNHKYTNGVILLDFPHSYEQAKLLEKELSGFMPKDEVIQSEFEKSVQKASLIVKGKEVEIVKRSLIKAGLDNVFYINIDKTESLRRALGRRYDPFTKQYYHLDDNIPPVDNAPLVERIEGIMQQSEIGIVDKNCLLDNNYQELKEWYSMFGQYYNSYENNQSDNQEGYEINEQEEQNQYEQENLDHDINHINSQNKQSELKQEQQGQNNSPNKDKQYEKNKQEDINIENQEDKKQQQQQQQQQQQYIVKKELICCHQAITNLANLWKNTQDYYINITQDVFYDLQEQKELIIVRFNDIQKKFLKLIQRQDNKFEYVRQYQEQYNDFVQNYPDMCEEQQTKEELHQRVEDLHNLLYDIIENKREEATEERNQIIKSGWIQKEMEKFTLLMQRLIQAELSRSFSCQQLIADYYTLVLGEELQEIPEYYKNDIISNQDSLPPVEDAQSFPRIEKIIDSALKLHNGEEEQEEKGANKKGGKVAKKEDKKAPKKTGKNAQEEVEEKKELNPLEKNMKEALHIEKSIFRYRIQVLKDFSISRLKEMKALSSILYGKLEDWIEYTFKIENDAVNEMDYIFRQYIEEEKKIQKEIQLNYVDVIISHQILNFLTPPPIILPAKETIFQHKFSISQLYVIIEEIRSITNERNLVESRELVQFLFRKTINKITSDVLPSIWRKNTIYDYQRLVLNLDPQKTGYVNSSHLCVYLCLLGATLPSNQELQIYAQNLVFAANGEHQIEKNPFMFTEAWFDNQESCEIEQYSKQFDRPKCLKELMFYVYKDFETDLVDINQYIQALSALNYIHGHLNENIKTYNDVLLS